ncbi:MAG TPA: RNA polymerase subunit sigma-70, partial [Solirubrobacteraceae bacterium]
GRRRVRGARTASEADPEEQRAVADAFIAAARAGDFDGLVAVLDPDVEFRIDFGPGNPAARPEPRGAEAVARQALARGLRAAPRAVPVLVNGAAGALVPINGRPFAVVAFTVAGGRITAIDLVLDRAKLRHVAVPG